MTTYEDETVGKIAARKPVSVRLFEKLGIDYCCGGALSLGEACRRAGIPLTEALSLLQELDSSGVAPERNWNEASAADLIAHITGTHHLFVRTEIARLQALLSKVAARHGAAHPETLEIETLFLAAAQELQAHLLREEQVLFPHIETMERSLANSAPPPEACFASVEFPISRMIADHDDAGDLFSRISALSNGYVPPDGACMSFQALYRGLGDFERDLHRHIHLENNILFPRAIEIERSLADRR